MFKMPALDLGEAWRRPGRAVRVYGRIVGDEYLHA